MTHFLPRALLLAASAAALTACVSTPTPRYPIVEGQEAGTGPTAIAVPRPAYPIREGEAPPPPPPPPPPEGDAEEAPAEPGDVAFAAPRSEGGIIRVSNLAPPAGAEPIQVAQLDPPAEEEAAEPPPAPRTETRTVVSVAGKVVAVDGKPKTYTVKSGQGLDAVARELGTTRKQLADDNNLKEPYRLKPGQVLKGPASKGAKAYVVDSGDTLYAIARRFNVKAAALADENNIEVGSAIRKGQKLRLPQGFKDSGPVKKTVTVTVDTPPPAPRPRPRPPLAQPPIQQPPVQQPPAEQPPVDTSPRPLPPVETPTPRPQPPVDTTPKPLPPAAQPPVAKPPVAKPPVAKPPVATPPVVASPPVAKPPVRPPVSPPSTPPSQPRPLPPLMPDDKPPAYTNEDYARMAAGRFQWPVRGAVISPYGPKAGGQRNDGVDIGASAGTPVVAAADGIVKLANELPGSGLTIIVIHADGWATVYANLRSADVGMDQRVTRGQKIGVVGQSGDAPRPQLHFEVRHSPSAKFKARAIDPQIVLPR
jgi:murein DD-endopeptidase MepM/ murein hydrolase activator NlpD